jgi:hypothetical protein
MPNIVEDPFARPGIYGLVADETLRIADSFR